MPADKLQALQGADLKRELAEAQFITEQYLACLQGGEGGEQCARTVDPEYAGGGRPLQEGNRNSMLGIPLEAQAAAPARQPNRGG